MQSFQNQQFPQLHPQKQVLAQNELAPVSGLHLSSTIIRAFFFLFKYYTYMNSHIPRTQGFVFNL